MRSETLKNPTVDSFSITPTCLYCLGLVHTCNRIINPWSNDNLYKKNADKHVIIIKLTMPVPSWLKNS